MIYYIILQHRIIYIQVRTVVKPPSTYSNPEDCREPMDASNMQYDKLLGSTCIVLGCNFGAKR